MPDGVHILHFGKDDQSLRTAIVSNESQTFRFDPVQETLEVVPGDMSEPVGSLLIYPETLQWGLLAPRMGKHFTQRLDSLSDCKFTVIPQQTWPSGAEGRTRTLHALDMTYILEQLGPENMYAELQMSFLIFVLVGNSIARTAWLRLLKIFCGCRKRLEDNPGPSYEVLKLIIVQLDILPKDYREDLAYELGQALAPLERIYDRIFTPIEPPVTLDASCRHALKNLLGKALKAGIVHEEDPDNF